MKTFLIFLALAAAMVLGQVSFLRPNPREKRLMALREEARRLGMNPRLLPPPDWLKPRMPHGLVACYSAFVEEGHRGLQYWRAERTSEGEWVTRVGDAALMAGLSLPPETAAILAIEARANAINLFWTESLGLEALPVLQQLLLQIRQKLE